MTRRRFTVALSDKARDEIRCRTGECLPNEIGGILLGNRDDDWFVITDAATVPWPHKAHNRYTRDDASANAILQQYLAGRPDGDPAGYIGEWHSHPRPSEPSPLDIAALRGVANDARMRLSIIIYCPHNGFHALVAARTRLGWVRVYPAEFAQ